MIDATLFSFLPTHAILTSEDELKAYGSDWTKTPGKAALVLLPSTTEEVAAILKICSEKKIAVVPSGGRTGLAGGAVALNRELVLNLSRLNKISPVDLLGRTVRVQAGATTQSVHEHCEKEGLTWPIDLAAKGTSQIGGNLSTNAGGVRVIRYGMARKWVSALTAVTMNGDILDLNRDLEKNNTGYDLLQLIIGSEGTLAVITEATLRLAPLPKNSVVFFFALKDVFRLNGLFEKARSGPFTLTAFEFFSSRCLEVVQARLNRKARLSVRADYYALMEVEVPDHRDGREGAENWLGELLEMAIVEDGLLAETSTDQKEVWGLREGITESLAMSGAVRKYDVCVPVRRTAEFLKAAEDLFLKREPKSQLFLFGHFGDGSPHLNFLKTPEMSLEAFHQEVAAYEAELYPLLKRFSGSVSAEHGIGCLKRSWVTFSRTPGELQLLKGIKNTFDPQGLLNPGKIYG